MEKPRMGVISRMREAPKQQSPGVPNINWKELIKFCRMKINSFEQFGKRFDTPNGPYFYRDNGSDMLLIAHTDYYQGLGPTHTTTAKLADDTLFFCPTLDDRAGAYAILSYLEGMGLKYDILLTTGEEKGQSSALFFKPPKGKKYKWMASFDRRGTDAVLYQYDDVITRKKLEKSGWNVAYGTYSDICDLEHLRCKGINFGVGYYAEHTSRCYLSRKDFIMNMRKFLRFYNEYRLEAIPHTPMWNQYTKEDGFGFMHKPKSHPYQDTFTDEDIEIIEALEREGFEFGSRVTPEDMKSIIQQFQEKQGLASALGMKKSQLDLFDNHKEDVNTEPIKILTVPLQRGSEDNPEYGLGSEQPRKAADLIKEDSEVKTSVHHAGKEGKSSLNHIKSEAEENGKETVMMDQCSTCHNMYETTISENTTQCPDCRGEVVDAEVEEVKDPTFKIVATLTLFRPKDNEVKYEYKHFEGKGWAWVNVPVRKQEGVLA